jgi:kumamolisin
MKFSKKTVFLLLAFVGVAALLAIWALRPDADLPWSSGKGTVALSGNTPPPVKEAEFLRHGDPERQVEIVVGLKLRNEQELNDLLARLADPASPEFRQFITADEFARRFSPTQQDYNRVVEYLMSHGLRVTATPPNRLIIAATGNIAQLERAFGVTINEYRLGGKVYISNDADPQIPARLQGLIQSVIGLNDFAEFQPLHTEFRQVHHQPKPQAGPPGLSPQQVATAYNYPNSNNPGATTKYSGAGRTVAVATAYSYNKSDVEEYWKQYGIKRTGTVTNIAVGGTTNTPNGETTLDLQQVGGQAPGANILMYLGKDPKFTTFTLVFNTIVTDNKADVVSISWGLCEMWTGSAQMQTEHAIFKQGAAQGQAFFAASGDDGAYDCRGLDPGKDDDGKPKVPPLQVDYPSSDPNVTAVGGTSLLLDDDNRRSLEIVWTGGGGGLSQEFARPSWQHGPAVPASDKRATADVALVADPWTGYAMYYRGGWGVSGGTSFSAPDWAALWALGCEASGKRLGPANPTLYRMGRSAEYGGLFYDVTIGDNGDGKGPGYKAGTSWDHPTGWGTPDGAAVVDWLRKDSGSR